MSRRSSMRRHTTALPATLVGRRFQPRHNSGTEAELAEMVAVTGFSSLDALIDATVPKTIRRKDGMPLGKYDEGFTESQFLDYFK